MSQENETERIPVFMEQKDAELFLQFQRHYEVFSLLVQKRVFEQKGASITLHFDNKGILGAVTRADVLYSDKSDFTNTN